MSEALNRTFVSLEVKETDQGRGYWLDQPWVSPDRRSALISAPILVVPSLTEAGDPVFPDGTAEFLERFSEFLPPGSNMAVAVSEEAYEELALHGKSWRIPTLVLTMFIWPVVTNIFSNRLDEILPGHAPGDTAEVTVIVEGSQKNSVKVTFKGTPGEIGDFLEKAVPKYVAALDAPTAAQSMHHHSKAKPATTTPQAAKPGPTPPQAEPLTAETPAEPGCASAPSKPDAPPGVGS